MAIKVNHWYSVKATGQYCFVQKIPSVTTPGVSVPVADERTRGFEVAVEWYTPADQSQGKWTKRVMIVELKKALALFREPAVDDLEDLEHLKSVAASLPVSVASRDGEFTWRV